MWRIVDSKIPNHDGYSSETCKYNNQSTYIIHSYFDSYSSTIYTPESSHLENFSGAFNRATWWLSLFWWYCSSDFTWTRLSDSNWTISIQKDLQAWASGFKCFRPTHAHWLSSISGYDQYYWRITTTLSRGPKFVRHWKVTFTQPQ